MWYKLLNTASGAVAYADDIAHKSTGKQLQLLSELPQWLASVVSAVWTYTRRYSSLDGTNHLLLIYT